MNETFVLNRGASVVNQYLAELRDEQIQQDSLRFKRNLRRIGWFVGFELSKKLPYKEQQIQTPLAMATERVIDSKLVVISILRAALPFSEGISDVFDKAATGFVGAMRKEGSQIEIDLSYIAVPDLKDKHVIIADPMLATGKSLVKTVDALLAKGKPASLDIATVISAPEGIEHLQANISMPYRLWTGAVDDYLNDKSYIVPGLGDAGDLSFGPKI